ncbi:Putative transposase [Methylobacterium oryzae CBMB20]|uniref:Transposase n=1 Tax=Methylobacterium oryzae CBMB20 TaxID=693986 RepID=A0A089NYD7_9HYPH|nr:transposase [Methylobacterium fujisawaense]AIQ92961.1 Putative transposase [Methylobacterium oryzae CBMB20]
MQQNGFVETLNGRLRDECLNEQLFRSLPAARTMAEVWRADCNTCRPHTSFGGLNPERICNPVRARPEPERAPVMNEGKQGARSPIRKRSNSAALERR